MPIANLNRSRAIRLQERINSPLQLHKVRLRGLGGPAVCGIPSTCASAAGGITGLEPQLPRSARRNSASPRKPRRASRRNTPERH